MLWLAPGLTKRLMVNELDVFYVVSGGFGDQLYNISTLE